VAVYSSTRADLDISELLGRDSKRLEMNSHDQPREGSHDKAARLRFNAS
jgi:hypothetical protein